jgi:hypothetical protein
MPTYITGNSNYPENYDLQPTGATTPTVSYVLDQLRDSGTGIITQSGDYVIARQVNSIYTIIQKMQEVVGINPEDIFNSLADRLNYLQYSGSLAFVALTGGTMLGDLTVDSPATLITNNIASSGLIWDMTGTSNITSDGQIYLIAETGITISSTGGSASFDVNDFLVDSIVSDLVASSTLSLSGTDIYLRATNGVTYYTDILPDSSGTRNIGSPALRFSNVYADNITSTGLTTYLSGNYVSRTGDSVTGTFTFGSGSALLNEDSGVNNIGDASNPFGDAFIKTLHVTNLSGMSPINLLSDIIIDSGVSIDFASSGTVDIGSISNPVGTLYADNVVSSYSLSQFISSTGGTMVGDLNFDSGTNVVLASGNVYPGTSGVGTLGTSTLPFNNIYTDKVNNKSVSNFVFNEILGGTADGVNKVFTIGNTPISNYAMVFVSGILLAPTTQYVISGTTVTLTGSMYAPTTAPIAGFYIY